jgi:hypothetical protein
MEPTGGGIRTVNPTQCHLTDLAGLTARDILGGMDVVREYQDDSHLMRRLYRCRKCGQLYFYEFYEEIDWAEGNDPQYCTLIPVEDGESAELLSKKAPIELLCYPSIRMDYPREAREPEKPHWANLSKLSS